MKILLFTDTLGDLNGVSRFILDMGELAQEKGYELLIATCTGKSLPKRDYIQNLPCHLRVAMPFYQELDLVWPKKQAIEVLIDKISPDLVHISTPGPFGWIAKNIAQKKGIPLIGTYHTDFPAYMKDLTGSKWIKHKTDKVMMRFYQPFTHVFSRSDNYLEVMASDIGIGYDRSSVIYPGTNLERFNASFKDSKVWAHYGLSENRAKVLYVGRINIEKNIPFLTEVWAEVQKKYPLVKADLVMVGEGRYRKWADRLRPLHAYFLGPVEGENLSKLYASSDLFVFPSITDTLGQVIMETQASGVSCMVSDIGGPQTLVIENETGQVLKANVKEQWVDAIGSFLMNASAEDYANRCIEHMQQYKIQTSFEHFMDVHEQVLNQLTSKTDEIP